MKRTLFFVLTLLALFSLLPAQNSPLTLTAPNGGEVWTTGSTYDITWIQANLAGNLSIMLIGANGPGSHTILIAQAVPVTDQTYSWTIPATVPPGTNYRVRISLINPNGMMLYDLSDAPFTIQGGTTPPPQPAITVVSPNGGETWDAGSTYDITWTYQNLEGDVRISLVGPTASQQQLITEATPIASGQYSWTIPATVAPGLYKIHIVWVTLLTVYFGDLSDAPFLIQGGTPPPPPPVPSLTLTAPNGGEIWDSGSSYDITWTFENVTGNVTLMLLGPATNPANNLIAQDIPVSVGTYAWTIPATVLPGDHYKVRISVGANAGFYITDVSDGYFTITGDVPPPPPVPVLTLTAPNGGEQWTSGSTYDITWTYENVTGNVTLMLLGPATNPANNLIAQNVPVTDETFAWTIP
ncbi:MAG TPA: Ser-Thr-rich GPI-anchored membrane family protein, partial [Candidatus Syntrophosphaera sp.]|nr:Ser-Thr-rich GPI-anchored membrane family protein [Candidatus Syntrophosphaera sp.]